MRFCIPSETKGGLDDQVSYHFGRAPIYTIYDDVTKEVQTIKNTSSHMGGIKLPAELLNEHKVQIMLCGGVGRRAIQMFEQYGIEVYTGAQGKVKDAIEQYISRSLKIATDDVACQEHKYRNKGHGDHHGHSH